MIPEELPPPFAPSSWRTGRAPRRIILRPCDRCECSFIVAVQSEKWIPRRYMVREVRRLHECDVDARVCPAVELYDAFASFDWQSPTGFHSWVTCPWCWQSNRGRGQPMPQPFWHLCRRPAGVIPISELELWC